MGDAFILRRAKPPFIIWKNGNGLAAFNGLFQRTAGIASTSILANGNVNVYLPTDDQNGSVLGSRSTYDMTEGRYEKLVIRAKRSGYGSCTICIADNPYGNNYYSGLVLNTGHDDGIVSYKIPIPAAVNAFYICFYGAGERSVEIESIKLTM